MPKLLNSKKMPKSQIELEIEVPTEEWEVFLDEAAKDLSKELKVNGFRPGHIPRPIVEQEIGREKILEKGAELAVKKSYIRVLLDNKIEAIGQPEIIITKIAPQNPLSFKAKTAILPEIKLPDYKKIAQKIVAQKKEIRVEEVEIQKALEWLRKSRAQYITVAREAKKGDVVDISYSVNAKQHGQRAEERANSQENKNKEEKQRFILGQGRFIPGFEEKIEGMRAGQEKDFSLSAPKDYREEELQGKELNFHLKLNLVQEQRLPELTDEFARGLGNFENLSALKKSVNEGLRLEKETKEKEKIRAKILEEIRRNIKVELPEILIQSQTEQMVSQIQEMAEDLGMSFQDYLKSIKKTEKDLREELLPEAKERITHFLILREIAKLEGIEATEAEIKEFSNKILRAYPDLESARRELDQEKLFEYAKERVVNEKVFELLEQAN